MGFARLKRLAPALVLGATFAFIGVEAAYSQTASFQPLNTAFSSVLSFMTGTFATTAATIAVVAAGFMALTSRIPWSWCFSIVVGVALIFGGAQIVQSLSSGMGTGG
ncbi:TrbC/VirB2 family protein [Methylocapsa sp. S129]|jgi:type IV secretion system protein VirB2|uniref:TrbC/VirB2 family protein n=1 Tax=Methylocapsa sp. S129 TaxID=1641869 RepID=UPI00131E1AF1|nr:TrbC/VirB2 family protein [Methylocapsa sp. S129]